METIFGGRSALARSANRVGGHVPEPAFGENPEEGCLKGHVDRESDRLIAIGGA